MADSRNCFRRALADEAQFEAGPGAAQTSDFTGQTKLKEKTWRSPSMRRGNAARPWTTYCFTARRLGQDHAGRDHRSELEVDFEQTSGPILQKKLDLTGSLNMSARDRCSLSMRFTACCLTGGSWYSALEDFRVDILIGAGPARARFAEHPKSRPLGRQRGRTGERTAARRFGLVLRLNLYDAAS